MGWTSWLDCAEDELPLLLPALLLMHSACTKAAAPLFPFLMRISA